MTELANKIYTSGIIPHQMKTSEFIAIPKKEGRWNAVSIGQ